MLLLKHRGKEVEVLAPVKVTIDENSAAIRSSDLIEIRNEIRRCSNTSSDIPDNQNSGYSSIDERLHSSVASLPKPNDSISPVIARKG